jgi:hypothetical protein
VGSDVAVSSNCLVAVVAPVVLPATKLYTDQVAACARQGFLAMTHDNSTRHLGPDPLLR